MQVNKKEFGFYPKPLEVKEGAITVRTLSDLDNKVEKVMNSDMVENDWIYAPYRWNRNLVTGAH